MPKGHDPASWMLALGQERPVANSEFTGETASGDAVPGFLKSTVPTVAPLKLGSNTFYSLTPARGCEKSANILGKNAFLLK